MELRNNGILFNGVLRPKLLKIPLTSCFLINLDSVPHIAHFDHIIVLPLLVFETLGFILSVFFYALNKKMTLFYIRDMTSVRCRPHFLPSSI